MYLFIYGVRSIEVTNHVAECEVPLVSNALSYDVYSIILPKEIGRFMIVNTTCRIDQRTRVLRT